MTRKRIDYKRKNRLTPEFISERAYRQNKHYKDYALNFGSAFRIMKQNFNRDHSEKKGKTSAKIKPTKPTKSKHYKRNKRLLAEITKRITDPQFPIGEQAKFVDIRKKIELQLQTDCYDQQSLEKLVYSALNPPPNPF
ncbi:hypothetical protein DSAG12_02264 [Promethearchaeum syntrophicum]|uniref:Uncharacterized protein n=1 Tax=Promethearchaeum syntrophicum TaxID=2594042 RepID=A0A5B9DBC8_9ARCH|nr:hypothetical protein [Candidatus Prometheoarchaeum syntrophicum]QEE16434.1 hypothetical protein DSAG12_02264 [Candidatus Prometheoarchaeum syntrophicum]